MGIFSSLDSNGFRNELLSSLGTWQSDVPPLDITRVTLQSLYGEDFDGEGQDLLPTMFREEAQTIPPVQAIANLLTASIGECPLQALNSNGDVLPAQPAWCTRADANAQNPWVRTTRTILDIYFDGQSLWHIDAKDINGYPLSMSNVWHQRWHFDLQSGIIYVDSEPVNPANYVLFQSPFPGMLQAGGRTLRTALNVERTLEARTKLSPPILTVSETIDANLDEPEVDKLMEKIARARHKRNGAAIFIPMGYVVGQLQDSPNNYLLEVRDSLVANFAQIAGVPSGLLEGAQFGSLAYSSELGQLSRYTDFNIRQYMTPITSRLSMGDVTPRGTTVNFDVTPLQSQAPSPLTDRGTPEQPNPAAPEAKDANA